jgi:GDP-D-mannose dehydratase
VPIVHLSFTRTDEIKALLETIRPDEIYNFASRSSSAQLFDDPIATSTINGLAVVAFLEVLHGTRRGRAFARHRAASCLPIANSRRRMKIHRCCQGTLMALQSCSRTR